MARPPLSSFEKRPPLDSFASSSVTSAQTTPTQSSLSDKIWNGLATTGSVLNKVLPGKQIGESIGTLAGYGITAGKEALGLAPQGATAAYDLSSPTLLQTAADAASAGLTVGSMGLGTAGSLAARTATGATLGAGLGGTRAVAEGKEAKDVAKATAIGGAVGGAIPIIGEGFRQFGKLLGVTGDKIQTSVIKPTQADIKDGFKIETLKKYNLGGSLKQTLEKTDLQLDDLTRQLNQKLADADSAVDLNKVYENTAKRVLGGKLEQFGSNTSMDRAIEQLRNEVVTVSGQNGIVTVPEAQLIKRASGHFGAWYYGAPDPDATARQKVYDIFYNEMKTAIEKGSPEGVKEINKQLSELIPVMNALIRRIPVAERNSALSLTDMITLATATVEPRALALTLANFASKSGTVGAALSRVGEKIAKPSRQPIQNILRTGFTNLLGLKGRESKQ